MYLSARRELTAAMSECFFVRAFRLYDIIFQKIHSKVGFYQGTTVAKRICTRVFLYFQIPKLKVIIAFQSLLCAAKKIKKRKLQLLQLINGIFGFMTVIQERQT